MQIGYHLTVPVGAIRVKTDREIRRVYCRLSVYHILISRTNSNKDTSLMARKSQGIA